MARNGAVLFGTLAIGTFFLHRDRGLARLVIARDAAGIMTRRLLLTSAVAILLLGWLAIDAVKHSLSSVEVATATLVVSTIIVTGVLIFSTAFKIQSIDRARQADSLALQESAERLKVATEAAELGIWIWNTDTNQVFASHKAKELFGIQEQSDWLDYDYVLSRVHPEDRDRVRRESNSRLVGAEYANEHRVLHADGSIRWLALRGSRLPSASGTPGTDKVFGVIWDATDEKLAEEALVRNEKLASVGRMAASIAHEVNNPLAAAMNLLFLSVTNPALPADVRQYVVDAQAELNRIAHITRQTLGFYREQLLPGNVAVEEVVAQLCDVYKGRAAHNGVNIVLRIRRPVCEVFGNAGEIRQVLSNLLVNAMDSITGGGTIHMRVVQTGLTVRITVADTGSGIEPRNLSRMFEAFFTTKKATGTGLGLWISRQIIERHAGKIRVKSKIGKGTVFTILLPTATARKTAAEEVLASS
jgi:PAS domain S-box-containing protein